VRPRDQNGNLDAGSRSGKAALESAVRSGSQARPTLARILFVYQAASVSFSL
jgi:hypothetical protein